VSTASRLDSSCIATATAIAACGALGFTPHWLPVDLEQVGIAADLGAGGFWLRHKVTHWREHRRKERKPAVITIRTDGAGKVTWTR
jgi:hypothetical protein